MKQVNKKNVKVQVDQEKYKLTDNKVWADQNKVSLIWYELTKVIVDQVPIKQ